MLGKPEFGEARGQQFDVARAIRSFIDGMAEGRSQIAPTVVKELIQNADDAGATSMSFILDERVLPADTPTEYSPLCGPALFVRNDAPFKTPVDVEKDEKDDFSCASQIIIRTDIKEQSSLIKRRKSRGRDFLLKNVYSLYLQGTKS